MVHTSLKHLIALESKTVLKTKTKTKQKIQELKDLQANCKELNTKSKQLKNKINDDIIEL